jgi:hypothetical protein
MSVNLMKRLTPMWLASFGAGCFIFGVIYLAFWWNYVRLPDTSAIIIDQPAPLLPQVIALIGGLMTIASALWAMVAVVIEKRQHHQS